MSNKVKDPLELGIITIQQEIQALSDLTASLGEEFLQCADLLVKCPGIVWITAVGTSAAVGARFAHILTCAGARSIFLSPSDGLHGHTAVVQPGDILVAMSRGGESNEVNQMVEIANQQGGITIAFVHNVDSSLANKCKKVLPIRSRQDYELMGYLATTSTVVFSAMCDALCAIVLDAKGVTPEKFARVHPGGAVGRVLTGNS